MNNLYVLFLGAVSFFLFNYIINLFANSLNLIDFPNERKRHLRPIPATGGITIYLAGLIGIYLIQIPEFVKILYFVASIPLIIGAIDDSKNLGITLRIFSIIFSTSILIGSGIYVSNLGFYEIIGSAELGSFGIIFTIIAVIGLTNAFNFIDGIDGLCASIFVVSLINLLCLSFVYGNYLIYEFIFYLITLTIVFLIFNIFNHNYKIFLGDAGSNLFGFLISWLLIYFSSDQVNQFHQSLVIWCVTIPLYDFFSVVIKRIYYRKNPFKYDRNHIHHVLLSIGYNQSVVLIILIISSFLIFLLGWIINIYFGHLIGVTSFIFLFIIYFYTKELILKRYLSTNY